MRALPVMAAGRMAIGVALEGALDAHRDALGACRRCAVQIGEAHGGVALPVLSEARSPRAMLVGQAPGKTETVDRRPFAGRAGRTLFRWLERAGIGEREARERIYIAAITRCYPGPHPAGRGDRVPSPAERSACAHWLADELALIRPAILIPVGRLAIDRFLGKRPLEALVGRAHEIEHEGGRSVVIPLPHPSGASSWIHEPGHAALLGEALALLEGALREHGVLGAEDAERDEFGGAAVGTGRDAGAPPRLHDRPASAPARDRSSADRREGTRQSEGAGRGAPPRLHDGAGSPARHHQTAAARRASARRARAGEGR